MKKVNLIKKRIFGKGHQMTCVLQPQRERGGRERERKRERERERERERMKGEGKKENMEKCNVSNKSAQEARYHESANDMCYLILLW